MALLCSIASLQGQEGGQPHAKASQDQAGPTDSKTSAGEEGEPAKSLDEKGPVKRDSPVSTQPPDKVPQEDQTEPRDTEQHFAEEANEIARLDLTAQKRMAGATEGMNYAAWASVVLTVVAVILLWGTLLYTRDAAGHTRIAADAATRAANAAQKSADAAMGVEVPRLVCTKIGEKKTVVRSGGGATEKLKNLPVEVTLINLGRTQAVISHEFITHKVCDALPDPPEFEIDGSQPIERNSVVRADGEFAVYRTVRLTDEEVSSVAAHGKTRVWVYGYVKFQDFMNVGYEQRFCGSIRITHPQKRKTHTVTPSPRLSFSIEGCPASYKKRT